MDAREVGRRLQRLPMRGLVISRVMFWVLTVAAGLAFLVPGWRGWGVAASVMGVVMMVWWYHVRERYGLSWLVAEDPGVVFWVHAARGPAFKGDIAECTDIVLHLRNGARLELRLRKAEMREFVAWLKEKNEGIRWGELEGEGNEAVRH